MKNIKQEELKEILKKHKMWLNDEEGGERANLYNTNLSYANLKDANLSYADLSSANLSYANLYGADLSYTNLRGTNLSYAKLNYANLRNADLIGANLWNARLKDACLKNIETSIYTIGYNLACPEENSFVGYKKANECIVKLLILEDSKRSSATTAKCRCDKAKVLDIEDINTGEKIKEVSSNYDPDFTYRLGEIVSVEDFDDNRWNECSTGIHFFVNKENALNY